MLANGIPTIYTSRVPSELIVFNGKPDFVPVVGTRLLWAANTTSECSSNVEQRLLRSARRPLVPVVVALRSVDVRRQQLVACRLLEDSAAFSRRRRTARGCGDDTGPGSDDRELDSQTASIPRQKGPTFTPSFDGPPQFSAVPRPRSRT